MLITDGKDNIKDYEIENVLNKASNISIQNESEGVNIFEKNKLPDPSIKSKTLKINCHTAFGPNTLVYVDKRIITITQMNIGYSNSINAKTLGIDPVTNYMKECGILSVPEKVFVNYTVDLIIDDTFAVECSPNSIVLCEQGYAPIDILNEGNTIQVTRKNIETGEMFVDNGVITKIDKSRSITAINSPVYLFISEYENLFIPYGSERTPNIINFINFKQ